MKTLKLSRSARYLLCLLTTALLLAMTPLVTMAASYTVEVHEFDFEPSEITIMAGDEIIWTHEDETGDSPHHIRGGDYQGRPCHDPNFDIVAEQFGNIVHEQQFNYTFTMPGDCYYRDSLRPGYNPLFQGVVHVLGTGTTTTTTTRPITTTTTTRPVTTTTTTRPTTTTTSTTTTTLPNQPPSLDSLTPVNISTLPSVVQSFTAGYSDPNGYLNMTDASLFISGSTHNEWIHYNPQTNRFTMMGVGGDCSPGQATTLSNAYLTLNCNSSSASGSGPNLTVTYNLTPQPPISGAGYRLILAAADQGSNVNKDMGYWVVNRQPSACSAVPLNSSTPVGTPQTFVCQYSDPDGYQNIAEANFYLSSGGLHNEWLHYVSAANIFFIMEAPGVCIPGQATTLSNGYLTFDCAASSVSGSGNNLTVTFRVTPQAPSSGINYNIFTGASDQAGAAHGAFGGTWQIP